VFTVDSWQLLKLSISFWLIFNIIGLLLFFGVICLVLVLKSIWSLEVVQQSDYNWTTTSSVASEIILFKSCIV